ncbi:MAG: hypothetical protein ACI4L2_04115 [Wujia sp.]
MNSFETDLKRAIGSKGFLIGIVLEVFILKQAGFDSDLFRVLVPVLATFPYATAWLSDYQSGYIKSYLYRSGIFPYICGKFLACGISGGLVELLGCLIYIHTEKNPSEMNLVLIFASAMFWALLSATLAAISNSRYIAYGGSFVIYYILVMLYERYFKEYYCLYPYEWLTRKHVWVFGDAGVLLLLAGLSILLFCIYYEVLRRCIERV